LPVSATWGVEGSLVGRRTHSLAAMAVLTAVLIHMTGAAAAQGSSNLPPEPRVLDEWYPAREGEGRTP
jgi:hypothetical protein